jgi:ectoine hydroxylase-related dioxygenase (phytanoyl-CoA dioxygenase family)
MARPNVALVERRPHPWNDGFEWHDHEGPFTTITTEQAAAYDRDGFFVIEDVFDAATLDQLDAELQRGDARTRRFLDTLDTGRFGVTGLDTQIVAPHGVMKSALLREVCAHPTLAGVARDLLGTTVRLYWEQSVYKQAHSSEPVLFHQDNGYTFVVPQSYVTCWIAVTDATRENGCIAVMPGVHRGGTLAHRNTEIGEECWGDWSTAVTVPVRAGSVVVFTSLTPHATFANATDFVRKAYIVQYAPDGAEALLGDPARGGPTNRVLQNDAERQFVVA